MGQDQDDFPAPGVGMPIDVLKPHDLVDARNRTKEARQIMMDSAVEGHVRERMRLEANAREHDRAWRDSGAWGV